MSEYKPGELSLLLNPEAGVPEDLQDVTPDPAPLSELEAQAEELKARLAAKAAKRARRAESEKEARRNAKRRRRATPDSADEDEEDSSDDEDEDEDGGEALNEVASEEEDFERVLAEEDLAGAVTSTRSSDDEDEEGDDAADADADEGADDDDNDDDEDAGGDSDPRLPRTVFVGNVPVSTTAKQLRRFFAECGKVESLRFRSVAFEATPLPRKAAFIKRKFHKDRDSMNAYVVFAEEEGAASALKLNGETLGGLHVRVDMAGNRQFDRSHSVFVGNMPFTATEEKLRAVFAAVAEGPIRNVRLVRDQRTNIGKGIGFVEFESEDDVKAALGLHNTKFMGRELRVMKTVKKVKLTAAARAKRARLQRRQGGGRPSAAGMSSRERKGKRPRYEGERSERGSKPRLHRGAAGKQSQGPAKHVPGGKKRARGEIKPKHKKKDKGKASE